MNTDPSNTTQLKTAIERLESLFDNEAPKRDILAALARLSEAYEAFTSFGVGLTRAESEAEIVALKAENVNLRSALQDSESKREALYLATRPKDKEQQPNPGTEKYGSGAFG